MNLSRLLRQRGEARIGKTAHNAFKRARAEEQCDDNNCLASTMRITRDFIRRFGKQQLAHIITASERN